MAAAGGDGGEIYLCLIVESSLLHCSSSQQLFVSGGVWVWVGWVVLVVAGAEAAPATSNKSKASL